MRLTDNSADITQANILVDHFGRARVTDFALATVYPRQAPTHDAMEISDYNTRWTAPEVLDAGLLTKKADVFSFAMLIIEVRSTHITQQL